MADLTQSSATTATSAPAYYTDYLSNLASKGTAAGAAVSPTAWDPNALQNQAFSNVASNVGNYQPGLATAGQTLGTAAGTDVTGAAQPFLGAGTSTSGLSQANPYLQQGTQGADQLVNNYMNPYTSSVVNQIGAANQQNIAQNLSPAITAGAVGSGQFGSQRGANALAMGISNADIGALTAQTGALQSGYTQALQSAQAQRAAQLTAGQTAGTLQNQANSNQVAAGQVAGNAANQEGQLKNAVGSNQALLANQTQAQGLTDTSALANLGGQQQTIAQQRQLMPLDVLGKQASIMSGAQLPMTTTSTMNASPLSAIAGLGGIGLGLAQNQYTKNTDGTYTAIAGSSPGARIADTLGNAGSGLATWIGNQFGNGTPASTTDTSNTYDPNATTTVDNTYTPGSALDPNSYGNG